MHLLKQYKRLFWMLIVNNLNENPECIEKQKSKEELETAINTLILEMTNTDWAKEEDLNMFKKSLEELSDYMTAKQLQNIYDSFQYKNNLVFDWGELKKSIISYLHDKIEQKSQSDQSKTDVVNSSKIASKSVKCEVIEWKSVLAEQLEKEVNENAENENAKKLEEKKEQELLDKKISAINESLWRLDDDINNIWVSNWEDYEHFFLVTIPEINNEIREIVDTETQLVLQNNLLNWSKKAARKFIKNSAFSHKVDEFSLAINNSTATVYSIDKATEKYMKWYVQEIWYSAWKDLEDVESGVSMHLSSDDVSKYLEFLDFYNQPYQITFNEKDSKKEYLLKKEWEVFIFEEINNEKIAEELDTQTLGENIEKQYLDPAIKEIEELQAEESISEIPENKQEYNDVTIKINGLWIDVNNYISSHPELNITFKWGKIYYKWKRFTIWEKWNKGKAEILGEISEITKKATKIDRLKAKTFLEWVSAVDRSMQSEKKSKIVKEATAKRQKKSKIYEKNVLKIQEDANLLGIKSGHKTIDSINDAHRIITKENKEKSNLSDNELLQQAAAKLWL